MPHFQDQQNQQQKQTEFAADAVPLNPVQTFQPPIQQAVQSPLGQSQQPARQEFASDAVPFSGQTQQRQPEQQQGFLESAGQAIQGAGRAVESGFRSLTGADNPFLGAGEVGFQPVPGDLATSTSRAAGIGVGFFLNRNEQRRAEIILEQVPTAEFTTDAQLAQERGIDFNPEEPKIMVRLEPGAEWTFINEPGIGAQDITDFASDIVKFLPAGRLASAGGSLGAKVFLGAGGSGITELASQEASQAFGSQQGADPLDVAAAAAGGGIAEPLVALGGGLIRRLRGRTAGDASVLSEGGAQALDTTTTNIPVTQAPVTGAAPEIPLTQARRELAQEFDVSLTRGQAARDPQAIRQEMQIVRGPADEARGVLRPFMEEQAQSLQAASRRLAGSTDPNRAVLEDVGSAISQNLQQAEAAARTQINDAYAVAREFDASMDAENFPLLARAVRMRIEAEGLELSTGAFPQTNNAISIINRMVKRADNQDVLDLRSIEQFRRRLNQVGQAADPGPDQRGVRRVVSTLDDWLDRAVDNALINGDTAGIDAFKEARRLRSRYARTFSQDRSRRSLSGRGIQDRAGAIIEQITHDELTGTQVMNLLYGRREIGVRGGHEVMERLIADAGEGSAQHQALREGAVARLMDGMPQLSQNVGVPPSVASRWIDAIDGSGKKMTEALFTEQEIFSLRRFARLLEEVAPPDGAGRTSGTPEGIQALIARQADGLTRALGFGVSILRQAKIAPNPNLSAARQAVSPFSPPTVSPLASATIVASTPGALDAGSNAFSDLINSQPPR